MCATGEAPRTWPVLLHGGGGGGSAPPKRSLSRFGLELGGTGRLDQFGHARLGGIGAFLANEIEQRTGYESRSTVLGHIQRGGTPTAFDRVLATRFGAAALAAVHEREFGVMVALRAGAIIRIPLNEAVGKPKQVDTQLYQQVANLYLG